MQTLSDSVCNLKHVTFIKKQCIISSFRFIFNDKIDETYALIPATIEDIRLITTAIQMVSNTIGRDEGYNKEYGLEMINEYARVGVHFDRSRNKWKVEIGVNGKNKYIGRYNTLEEATKARRDAELLYYNVNYEINQTKF